MNKSPFLYKNVFLYASLQFCGNIEEYFFPHTEKLIVFIVMPRLKNKYNLIRLYKKGKLIHEKKVLSSDNMFMYYALWYIQYVKALFQFFSKDDSVHVIVFHPLALFGMSILKLFRRVEFVYWIGDYFPPVHLSLRLFEKIKKLYHDNVSYSCYLSNRINEKLNGKILNTTKRKTVMWGVRPKDIKRSNPKAKDVFTILFVGLIKESQGLERVFDFMKDHKDFNLKVIGACEDKLYKKYRRILKKNLLDKRVYFPNRFVSDQELLEISKDCHVGIALYDTDPNNATHFADPGKVKLYFEMGLPIIMSNISDITNFVKKYKSGEVIEQEEENLLHALLSIKKNYSMYRSGVDKFNKHFYFEDYYKKAFLFIES